MDKIKIEELILHFPKTWEIVNSEKYHTHIYLKQVLIRKFLECNGYSICCVPVENSSKVRPSVVFRGSEVGKTGFFRTNENDFELMTMTKGQRAGLMYALRDFERNCYNQDWY